LLLIQVFLLTFVEEGQQIDFVVVLQEIVHVAKAPALAFAPRWIFSAGFTDAGQSRDYGSARRIRQKIALDRAEHVVSILLGEAVEPFGEAPELNKEDDLLYYRVG